MKVVIDISLLHPAALKRGVGFYSLNLFKALKELKDNNQYFLKRKKTDKFSSDLTHFPFFDPFFLTLPYLNGKNSIVTIHDLTPLKFPQYYPSGIKGKIKWQIQKKIVKTVKAIVTDSCNSKKDIVDIVGYSQERVFPIHLAADKEFRKINTDSLLGKIKKKHALTKDFILYVGDLNWNKNLKGLIKAFGKAGKINQDFKLVLVGGAFENQNLKELKELKRLIKELELNEKVTILGFVSTKDLVGIYNLAKLYIQPSFYEGFGLPVLEAMSCGCPVLCSNQASLPEIGEKRVEYFDPHRRGNLENKLISLLKDKKRLGELERLGLKQSKKFSWKKVALETRKVYEQIIG